MHAWVSGNQLIMGPSNGTAAPDSLDRLQFAVDLLTRGQEAAVIPEEGGSLALAPDVNPGMGMAQRVLEAAGLVFDEE